MKSYFPLLFILIFTACQSDELTFQKVKITFDHFPYLTGVYQTSDSIQAYYDRTKRTSLTSHFYNQIGKNQLAAELYDADRPADTTQVNVDSLLSIYQPVSAINFIKNKAEKHDLVIVNEAHHVPQHRVFTEQLLEDLYAIGYRHLGLETLANPPADSTLSRRDYPVLKDGTYTLDPRFANLVRTAKRVGYQVFPYERISGRGKFREIEQAQHIAAYWQQYPDDKILIHCGYNHVKEGYSGGRWEYAMAERVKRLTEKDPLTIDQVQYRERGKAAQEHPLYRAVALTESSILVDKNERPLPIDTTQAYVDLHIFHPRTTYPKNGREDWLYFADYKPYQLGMNQLDVNCPCVVRAYRKSEPLERAVPIDAVEIQARNEVVNLILPTGEYKVLVTNNRQEQRVADYVAR